MATYITRTFSGYCFECYKFDPFTGQSEPFSVFIPVGDFDKAYKLASKQVAGIGMIKLNPDTMAPECTAVDNETRRMKLEDFYRLSELVGGEDTSEDTEAQENTDTDIGETEPPADTDNAVGVGEETPGDGGDFAD